MKKLRKVTAGTWGPKVLQNDENLDRFSEYLNGNARSLRDFVMHLLTDDDEYSDHYRMFGVAIVDASLNGVDKEGLLGTFGDYPDKGKKFFYDLIDNPLNDLIPLAIKDVNRSIKDGVDSWKEDCQQDRMNLYYRYKNRLQQSKGKSLIKRSASLNNSLGGSRKMKRMIKASSNPVIFEDEYFSFERTSGTGVNQTPWRGLAVITKKGTLAAKHVVEIRLMSKGNPPYEGKLVQHQYKADCEVAHGMRSTRDTLEETAEYIDVLEDALDFAYRVRSWLANNGVASEDEDDFF